METSEYNSGSLHKEQDLSVTQNPACMQSNCHVNCLLTCCMTALCHLCGVWHCISLWYTMTITATFDSP